MKGLIELHYLPSVQYMATVCRYNILVIEKHEHFVKQTPRSRCVINTSQGLHTLIVPLMRHPMPSHSPIKIPISEVRIDYSQKWLNNHWRSIQSAYAKAPFFEHYADALHAILIKRHAFLYDLNFELLTMCLRWLKLQIKIQETLSYEESPAQLSDLRNTLSDKSYALPVNTITCKPYTQVFGNTFVKHVSFIDLLFCTGPQASDYLKAGA